MPGTFPSVATNPCMNILIRAGLLLLLGVLPLSGASTNLLWRWSNPLPFGANIADLAVRSGEPVVAVAEYGQLFTSTDLVNWTRENTGTSRWLRSATYFGNTPTNTARLLIASGQSGTLLVSEDFTSFQTIDLNTADWLEGITASATRAVAVGDNAAIYTSDDGTNWVRRSNNFNGVWLRGVTWRPNGVFVTVGEGGLIATSANGINWTRQNSRTTANLNRVIATPTGFVAVGEGGTVVVDSSGNGTSWRNVSSGATGDLYAAALEVRTDLPGQPTGALLIAGDSELRSGVLAVNLWVDETDTRRSAPAPKATYLAGFWDTDAAVFAGRAGLVLTGVRPTTTSSFQWSLPDSPPRSWLFSAATNASIATNTFSQLTNGQVVVTSRTTTNSLIVAVGDGPTILQSDRGISWSTALLPTNASGIVYLGVASQPGRLVAVGSSGIISQSTAAFEPLVTTNLYTNSAGVAVSVVLTNQINTLGLAWSASVSGVTNTLQGIATDKTRWVACGSAGILLTSTNGTNWSRLNSPVSTFLSSVEASPTRWVASGDNGTLITSADGSVWSPVPSGTSQWIWRTRWLNNQFVAVGFNGTLLTSPDGLTWTSRNSGVTNNLNDVLWVDGTYYAVGNQGAVLGSTNAIQWSSLATITTKSLQGLAFVGGRLLAVGADGAILRAVVSDLPTVPKLAQSPTEPSANLFLLTGELDQHLQLGRGTNLTDWIVSPPMEVTDPSGTLLFLDSRPNDPWVQFFRAQAVAP
jgi:hypothetical protein